MRHAAGNSLAEYVVPTALIVLTAGLIGVMTNIQTALPEWVGDTINGNVAGGSIKVNALGNIPPAARPGASSGLGGKGGSGKLDLKTLDSLTDIAQIKNFSDSVDTAGGLGGEDGGLKIKSAILKKIADELKLEGADNGLTDLITRLANSGHDIGSAVNQLQSACSGSGSCSFEKNDLYGRDEWMEDPALAAGKDLYENIKNCGGISTEGCRKIGGRDEGYLPQTTRGVEELSDFQNNKQALDQYLQAHPELASNFLIQQAKQIINENVQEIQSTTENISISNETQRCGKDCDMQNETVVVKGTEIDHPEEVIHDDSNHICDEGGRGCHH